MGTKTFFTDEEKQAITEAVREAERHTSGEIAVMVAERSDGYPEARLLAGISLGGLAALLITDLLLYNNLNLFVPLAAVLALCGWHLAGRLPLLVRAFTLSAQMEARVRERALRAFYEGGLHRTRDETGVLFFISVLERKVWVLADRGIYTRITQEALTEHAREVARGVRENRAGAVLCDEIRKVGTLLAAYFPPRADDVNELPDEVIVH